MFKVAMWQMLGIALAGAAGLLVAQSILVAIFAHQSLWQPSWQIASVFMGPGVLTWPATFDFAPITAALVALWPLSLVFVLLLAGVAGRLDLKRAALVGTGLGLGFYFLSLYGLVGWFPWLAPERSRWVLLSYLVFGAWAAWLLKRWELLFP